MSPDQEIKYRINAIPEAKLLTVLTSLHHLSIITFKVEYLKLRKSIPEEYDIYTTEIDGKKYGFVSAVTFLNKKFRFKKIFPFLKFNFYQTNYRAYVVDKKTGTNVGWFFGTTLGSRFVHIPNLIWKMPWFFASYTGLFSVKNGLYDEFKISIQAPGHHSRIDLKEITSSAISCIGFPSTDQARLVLTHPITGYFLRDDGRLATYNIWHPAMPIRNAEVKDCYFEKFEQLGLLTKEDMQAPYSVLLTDQINYIICLPPHTL